MFFVYCGQLYVPQLIVQKYVSLRDFDRYVALLYDNLKQKFWQLLTAFLAGNCKVWGSETKFSDKQNKEILKEKQSFASLLSFEIALNILYGDIF